MVVVMQVTSLYNVFTLALMDTLSSLLAQINVAMKVNCLAPVVLLNMCDKSKLSKRICTGAAKNI